MRYIINVDSRINVIHEVAEKFWKLPVYVPFTGAFTEESASKFRHDLEQTENVAKSCGQKIIPVTIDSYGGSVYALLSMIDAINNCSIPVATIVEGKAMSCGAVLFACGAEGHRYIGENATVMIHTVSSMGWGKIDEIKASADEANRLNDKVFELMAKNCGHKSSYFLDILQQRRMADWYLDANDCVKHKLANRIHIPSINVNITYDFKFE